MADAWPANYWPSVVEAARWMHRAVIGRWDDACPVCGLCDPEWKAGCIRDWCPARVKHSGSFHP